MIEDRILNLTEKTIHWIFRMAEKLGSEFFEENGLDLNQMANELKDIRESLEPKNTRKQIFEELRNHFNAKNGKKR